MSVWTTAASPVHDRALHQEGTEIQADGRRTPAADGHQIPEQMSTKPREARVFSVAHTALTESLRF